MTKNRKTRTTTTQTTVSSYLSNKTIPIIKKERSVSLIAYYYSIRVNTKKCVRMYRPITLYACTATLNATLCMYVETPLSRLIEGCKYVVPPGIHSSRTVLLLTRQSWFRIFLPPTAVTPCRFGVRIVLL